MKIKFLFPLLIVPFFAIACGNSQQQKLPSEQNQQSQKTPPTEGNISNSPQIDLVFQKMIQILNHFLGKSQKMSLKNSFLNHKSQFFNFLIIMLKI
ncbi:hypothetical protein Q4607_03095 [Mesomycoplasma ovipneumoniae]|uniref:hypothetical protein n=1 Tax=Mesomycoplasma ovipneumoniae TaxID=29562 RepID=UPI0026E231C5|nr:hypothetical protein [Mesomycoplasma ovipneumoniae]MDO6855982.1 hypothetical protein [Mesomycoplasma ovipneumoniae]